MKADQASSIPTSSKVLCVVYRAIAIAALIATWSPGASKPRHPEAPLQVGAIFIAEASARCGNSHLSSTHRYQLTERVALWRTVFHFGDSTLEATQEVQQRRVRTHR